MSECRSVGVTLNVIVWLHHLFGVYMYIVWECACDGCELDVVLQRGFSRGNGGFIDWIDTN